MGSLVSMGRIKRSVILLEVKDLLVSYSLMTSSDDMIEVNVIEITLDDVRMGDGKLYQETTERDHGEER